MSGEIVRAAWHMFLIGAVIGAVAWQFAPGAVGLLSGFLSRVSRVIDTILVAGFGVAFGIHSGPSDSTRAAALPNTGRGSWEFGVGILRLAFYDLSVLQFLWIALIIGTVVAGQREDPEVFRGLGLGLIFFGVLAALVLNVADWTTCIFVAFAGSLIACVALLVSPPEAIGAYWAYQSFFNGPALLGAVALALLASSASWVLWFVWWTNPEGKSSWLLAFRLILASATLWLAALAWSSSAWAAQVLWRDPKTSMLPYLGVAFGGAYIYVSYRAWQWDGEDRAYNLRESARRVGLSRVSPRHYFGLVPDIIFALGLACFLAVIMLALLDGGRQSSVYYEQHVLDAMVAALNDIGGRVIDAYNALFGNATAQDDLSKAFTTWWKVVISIAFAGSGFAIYRGLLRGRASGLEQRLLHGLEKWTPADVDVEAREIASRGERFVQAAFAVADDLTTHELLDYDGRPHEPRKPQSIGVALLGYLLAAWVGMVQTRQKYLTTAMRIIGDRLDVLLPPDLPAIVNHQPVAGKPDLPNIIAQLRSARAEWSNARAPLNWAGVSNLLAIELGRFVEARWRMSNADLAAHASLLEEAAQILREAAAHFAPPLDMTHFDPTDFAAIHHNLGTILLLLGQLKRDKSRLTQATEAFNHALGARASKIDAAATLAHLALAHALLARWTGNDRHVLQAAGKSEVAISYYEEERVQRVGARENYVACLLHAGNMALASGASSTAVWCFGRAVREADDVQGWQAVHKVPMQIRLVFASARAAQDALSRASLGGLVRPAAQLPDLERARRELRRAQGLIKSLTDNARLLQQVIRQGRGEKDPRRDYLVRALILAAAAKRWVANEYKLIEERGSNTATRPTDYALTAAMGVHTADTWNSTTTFEQGRLFAEERNNLIIASDASSLREFLQALNADGEAG